MIKQAISLFAVGVFLIGMINISYATVYQCPFLAKCADNTCLYNPPLAPIWQQPDSSAAVNYYFDHVTFKAGDGVVCYLKSQYTKDVLIIPANQSVVIAAAGKSKWKTIANSAYGNEFMCKSSNTADCSVQTLNN